MKKPDETTPEIRISEAQAPCAHRWTKNDQCLQCNVFPVPCSNEAKSAGFSALSALVLAAEEHTLKCNLTTLSALSDAAVAHANGIRTDEAIHNNRNEGEKTMNFGQAVDEAKAGKKIAREGWNGKNMWVCYMPPVVIPEGVVNGRTKAFVPTGDLNVGGYMVMWTAAGVWQPGWLAAQPDMLADDWSVVS